MTVGSHRPQGRSLLLSRRRVLSSLVTAAAAPLWPVRWDGSRASAQTPIATPSAGISSTLLPEASASFQAVAEALAAALEATGTPGAALGILAEGREEHAAFGLAGIENDAPVSAATLFQTGSIAKTFTGTAVMRLIESGALDIDATVRTYLPDLRLADEDVAERVTVRHLLTHTGGWWGDLFADTGSGPNAIANYVARWFPELPQLSPLGAYVSYNNAGFILLGRLIEEATGQEYRAAMRQLVLNPLHLADSVFAPDEVMTRPHAQGHYSETGLARIQEPLFLPRATDPAGGLWSTTRDMLRFARFHLGDGTVDGERILAAETWRRCRRRDYPSWAIPRRRWVSPGSSSICRGNAWSCTMAARLASTPSFGSRRIVTLRWRSLSTPCPLARWRRRRPWPRRSPRTLASTSRLPRSRPPWRARRPTPMRRTT
jgi:CubicO group peptidase (beta-lactamase class C family)